VTRSLSGVRTAGRSRSSKKVEGICPNIGLTNRYVVTRLPKRLTSFDGSTYTEATGYDGAGRVATQTDASGSTTATTYTTRGYVSRYAYSLAGVGSGGIIYEVLDQDAWGHVTQERRGGSITTTKTFDPLRGWIDTVSTAGGTLQNWNFDFDTDGNLIRRNRGNGALVEDFVYDKLDRLTQVAVSGTSTTPLTTTFSYDKLGNLCSRGRSLTRTREPTAATWPGVVPGRTWPARSAAPRTRAMAWATSWWPTRRMMPMTARDACQWVWLLRSNSRRAGLSVDDGGCSTL
jgi:YD repeat-containing protein